MYYSTYAKQRGQRRKLKKLIKNMQKFKPFENSNEKYEHFHVPCSTFIQHKNTYSKIKKIFCKEWLEITEKYIQTKPANLSFCKIVAVIHVPYYWSSQIIIFYDEEYYNSFWNRNDSYQKWILIENGRSFKAERSVNTSLNEKGYIEIIDCEDGVFQSELWFYGDV